MSHNITKQNYFTLTPNADTIWVCIFCQQGPHDKGMGDLFGPYYISSNKVEQSTNRKINTTPVNDGGNQCEVWFHEDCLIWSNGVFSVGHKIMNLEEVVKDCYENICCECKLKGASLGCFFKKCPTRYHFLCAKEKGCEMIEENFSIYCAKHKHFYRKIT